MGITLERGQSVRRKKSGEQESEKDQGKGEKSKSQLDPEREGRTSKWALIHETTAKISGGGGEVGKGQGKATQKREGGKQKTSGMWKKG